MTAFCTSPKFFLHQTGPHHPERPDRLRAIFAAVRDAGMIDSPNPLPDDDVHFGIFIPNAPKLLEIQPTEASDQSLLAVHTQRHIDRVRMRCETGGVLDQGDTVVGRGSFKIALLAAGAGLRCVDAVLTGQVRRAFACVRPPGHHAMTNQTMGFCLFANLAIAARYAQKQYGVQRIAIVDFDVHHGNGTQAIFEADPSVLFISLHQDPREQFPNTGYEWEIGTGAGRGYTLNVPLPGGANDAQILQAMRNKVLPKLEAFRPELLMLSAGFDGHRDDPVGEFQMTEQGYYDLTLMLGQVADRFCGGRIVSMLEGGYSLRALGRSVVKHLLAMSQE